MELAEGLLKVVHILCGGAVTLEVIFMVARLTNRAVSQAGR